METDISKENLNDFHWKNKLEEVSELPGEILTDKNAAWEKLHSRLKQKPHRTKAVWYWAAAACLLLAVFIPFLKTYKNPDNLVRNNPPHNQPQKTAVAEIIPSKENVIRKGLLSLGKKKKSLQLIRQTTDEKDLPVHNKVQMPETVLANANVQPGINQPPSIATFVVEGTDEAQLAAMPVKKALKVVHINELDDSGEESLNIVRHYEHRSFQLKLISKEVYTSLSLPSKSTDFYIFKTKIPPSN